MLGIQRTVFASLFVATRSGFEPPISALTGQCVKPATPPGHQELFKGCMITRCQFSMTFLVKPTQNTT